MAKQSNNGKASKGKKTPQRKLLELTIKRVNPDNVRPTPVNDVLITHSQNEFYITFSSVEPPGVVNPEEIAEMTTIDAIARAKIVVSPEYLEAIIKVFSTNLETFRSR